jgi:hypothetical protein
MARIVLHHPKQLVQLPEKLTQQIINANVHLTQTEFKQFGKIINVCVPKIYQYLMVWIVLNHHPKQLVQLPEKLTQQIINVNAHLTQAGFKQFGKIINVCALIIYQYLMVWIVLHVQMIVSLTQINDNVITV